MEFFHYYSVYIWWLLLLFFSFAMIIVVIILERSQMLCVERQTYPVNKYIIKLRLSRFKHFQDNRAKTMLSDKPISLKALILSLWTSVICLMTVENDITFFSLISCNQIVNTTATYFIAWINSMTFKSVILYNIMSHAWLKHTSW